MSYFVSLCICVEPTEFSSARRSTAIVVNVSVVNVVVVGVVVSVVNLPVMSLVFPPLLLLPLPIPTMHKHSAIKIEKCPGCDLVYFFSHINLKSIEHI